MRGCIGRRGSDGRPDPDDIAWRPHGGKRVLFLEAYRNAGEVAGAKILGQYHLGAKNALAMQMIPLVR